jgi:TRAP-type C4-dicarboxylate transport system permease small subunit
LPFAGIQNEAATGLRGPLLLLERICGAINLVAETLVGVLMAVMILDIFVQVVFRYALESSLSWSEELARYLFVWVIFVGASVAVRRGQHIALTAITGSLPEPFRSFATVLTLIAFIAFIAFLLLLTWACIPLIVNARFTVSSELEVPIAWVYAAAPIGSLISVLHLSNGLARLLWSRRRAR